MSAQFGGQPTVFGVDVSFIGKMGTIARDFYSQVCLVCFFFHFILYFTARNKTSHEPITPTIKLKIRTKSWIKIPYKVRINVPHAKITKLTKEIFSADFVLYNLYAWGKYPIDMIIPTAVVNTWKNFIATSFVILAHQDKNLCYTIYTYIFCNKISFYSLLDFLL